MYMRNKEIRIICGTSRVIFRPLPICNLPNLLSLLPPLQREVLYARSLNIYKAPFSDSEAFPN